MKKNKTSKQWLSKKHRDLYFKQSKIWRILLNIVESSRIGSAYLFSGPQGSGKEALAIKFAQFLNCELKLLRLTEYLSNIN